MIPVEREILFILKGGRHVVFSQSSQTTEKLFFKPNIEEFKKRNEETKNSQPLDWEGLKAIPNQPEVQSVQCSGCTLSEPPALQHKKNVFDYIFHGRDGVKIYVELKAYNRSPSQNEITKFLKQIEVMKKDNLNSEFWILNLRQLKLIVLTLDSKSEFLPSNIWSYREEIDEKFKGVERFALTQGYLISRIDNWEERIKQLYNDIEHGLSKVNNCAFKRKNNIDMNEEVMTRFLIPQRELPSLDISVNKKLIISLIPYGLWIVGANGRIDILMPGRTLTLVDFASYPNKPEWKIFTPSSKQHAVPFTNDILAESIVSHEA